MPDGFSGRINSEGFKGHLCLFCAELIDPDDTRQLVIYIEGGTSRPRFRAHRACLANHMHAQIKKTIEVIPPERRWDILP